MRYVTRQQVPPGVARVERVIFSGWGSGGGSSSRVTINGKPLLAEWTEEFSDVFYTRESADIPVKLGDVIEEVHSDDVGGTRTWVTIIECVEGE